jgi:hypothetical protein
MMLPFFNVGRLQNKCREAIIIALPFGLDEVFLADMLRSCAELVGSE